MYCIENFNGKSIVVLNITILRKLGDFVFLKMLKNVAGIAQKTDNQIQGLFPFKLK